MRTWLQLAALLSLATLQAGCAGNSLSTAEISATASSSPTGEYLIGPGDILEVFVWREPELSVTVPVRPDGRISTPLVQDVVAVNKTPTQLALDIEAVLSEYLRAPEVNVIVQGFVGTFGDQVRVLGQATEPQSIPYRDRMTILDVVIQAGGLSQFAAGNRTRVIRSVGGQSQEIRVRLDDLVNRGDIEQNIVMQPGDVVIIPQSVF